MAPAKVELRHTMRALRDAIPAEVRVDAGLSISKRLLSSASINAPGIVALYAAVHSELPTGPSAKTLHNADITVAYPRVCRHEKTLQFSRVDTPSALVQGSFGVPEPTDDAPIVPLPRIDIFIVPGLAFDRLGRRLGWGQGYYDRILSTHTRALRVGFAFHDQLVDHVPVDDTDQVMDIVLTDRETIHTQARTLT